ncbi:hypothetical protein V5O48_016927 [Marasmius crinis-equi]|uniref:C2H2-type domain-containing protein n=1 Tax=Marasmius crinis-equi TaxID=585013 RepID=A0ABR3EQD5_9AGAR
MPSNPTSKTLPGTPNTNVTTATEISLAGTRWGNTGGIAVTTHTVVNATSITTLKRIFSGTGTTVTGGVMIVGIVSPDKEAYDRHLAFHHDPYRPEFYCKKCEREFKTRTGLDDHKYTTRKIQKWKLCDADIAEKFSLRPAYRMTTFYDLNFNVQLQPVLPPSHCPTQVTRFFLSMASDNLCLDPSSVEHDNSTVQHESGEHSSIQLANTIEEIDRILLTDVAESNLEDRLRLKSKRNSFTPVCRLPAEVLGEIFAIFVIVSRAPADLAFVDRSATSLRSELILKVPITSIYLPWTVVLHVCRHWRAVALGTPKVWSTPDFNHPSWARRMIELSKTAPLTIDTSNVASLLPYSFEVNPVEAVRVVSIQETSEVVSEALGEIDRVTTLRLEAREEELKSILSATPSLIQPAPLLTSLIVTNRSDPRTRTQWSPSTIALPKDFLAQKAPQLSRLELDDCYIPWCSGLFRNLTIFSLYLPYCPLLITLIGFKTRYTPQEFMDALKSMTRIEVLELQNCIPSESGEKGLFPHETLVLPNLCQLKVWDGVKACVNLLKTMRFPRWTVVHLQLEPDYHNGLFGDRNTTTIAGLISSYLYRLFLLGNACSDFESEPRKIKALMLEFDLSERRREDSKFGEFIIKTWDSADSLNPASPPPCQLSLKWLIRLCDVKATVQKILHALPRDDIETLKLSLPEVSDEIVAAQCFGWLPRLQVIILRDACAYEVVRALGCFNLPRSGSYEPPSDSPFSETSTSMIFPSLRVIALVNVNQACSQDVDMEGLCRLLLKRLNIRKNQYNVCLEKLVLVDFVDQEYYVSKIRRRCPWLTTKQELPEGGFDGLWY